MFKPVGWFSSLSSWIAFLINSCSNRSSLLNYLLQELRTEHPIPYSVILGKKVVGLELVFFLCGHNMTHTILQTSWRDKVVKSMLSLLTPSLGDLRNKGKWNSLRTAFLLRAEHSFTHIQNCHQHCVMALLPASWQEWILDVASTQDTNAIGYDQKCTGL